MGKQSREEILIENQDFYNDFYARNAGKKTRLRMSFVMAFFYALAAWRIVKLLMYGYYRYQATIMSTNGLEVTEWIDEKVKSGMALFGSDFPIPFMAIIVGVAGGSVVYIFILTFAVKNYVLYKHKFFIIGVPVLVWVVFIVSMFWLMHIRDVVSLEWINPQILWALVLGVLELLQLISAARTFITAETRPREDGANRIIECLSNVIINHLM